MTIYIHEGVTYILEGVMYDHIWFVDMSAVPPDDQGHDSVRVLRKSVNEPWEVALDAHH